MTPPTHKRARCGVCNVVCEQASTTMLVGGVTVPALQCLECGVTYAKTPPDVGPGEPPSIMVVKACAVCGASVVNHRVVRDPSGAEFPVTDCVDCEKLCLSTRIATDHERVESERNQALEAKCGLLEASVRQSDGVIADLARQLKDSETTKLALREQLLACERKSASLRPPADLGPCKHCGEARLTKQHFIAGGGHSFEAAQ